MKRFVAAALAAALCLSLTACLDAASGPAPIAVVDTEKILTQSGPAKEAEEHLQKVQRILQKGLDDLAALYKGKENTPEARRALAEGHAALQNRMAAERRAVAVLLDQLLRSSVRDWRAQNPRAVVISQTVLLDSDASVDATEAVLASMNTLHPAFPPLPSVTVTPPQEKSAGEADRKAAQHAPANRKTAPPQKK